MGYKEINKLFAESAGRCNFLECKKILYHEYEDKSFISLGELCHIIGESPSGPRGHPTLSEILAKDENNLILLCGKHHKIVDGKPEEYPVETMLKMKEDHLNWVKSRLDISKDTNWTLIIHSGNVNGTGLPFIDEELIFKDFINTYIIANIERIEVPEYLVESKNWIHYKEEQRIWWEKYQKQNKKPVKFVICSISFIPLVIHLGYLLHDTSSVEIHQFNRSKNTWNWQEDKKTKSKSIIFKFEKNIEEDTNIDKIALAICISKNIRDNDIFEVFNNDIKIIKIGVKKPSRNWLEYKEQLICFRKFFIDFIDNLDNSYPNLNEIHLFYSGPTPIAFILGSSINPNIHPKFILYNFYTKDKPKYQRVFNIE